MQDSLNVVRSECESLRNSKEMLSESLEQKSKELDEVIKSFSRRLSQGESPGSPTKIHEEEHEDEESDSSQSPINLSVEKKIKERISDTSFMQNLFASIKKGQENKPGGGDKQKEEISFLQENIRKLQAEYEKEQGEKKEVDQKLTMTQKSLEQKIKWLELNLNEEKKRNSSLHLGFNEKEKMFLRKIEILEQNVQNLTKSYTLLSKEKAENEKRIRRAKEIEKALYETQEQFKKYVQNIEALKKLIAQSPKGQMSNFLIEYQKNQPVAKEDKTNEPRSPIIQENYPLVAIQAEPPDNMSMNRSIISTSHLNRSKIIKPMKGGQCNSHFFSSFFLLKKQL